MKLIKRKDLEINDRRILVLEVRRNTFWPFYVTEEYCVVYGMEEFPNWFKVHPFEEIHDFRNYKLFDMVSKSTRENIEQEAQQKEKLRIQKRLKKAKEIFDVQDDGNPLGLRI